MAGGGTNGSSSAAALGQAHPRQAGGTAGNRARVHSGQASSGLASGGQAKRQAAPRTTTTLPFGERAGGAGLISPSGLWEGGALDVGTILSVPATLAGLAVVFFVLQWLIDRRDPKFVDAPLREDDDSIGFD